MMSSDDIIACSDPQAVLLLLLPDGPGRLGNGPERARRLQPLQRPDGPITARQIPPHAHPPPIGRCVANSPRQRVLGQPEASILQGGGAFVVPCLLAL